MDDFDFGFYNRHYIKVREDGVITDAFSDGPLNGKKPDGYICFNEKAGYQLRLIVDGELTEENPPLRTMDGIPLYKWDGEAICRRTENEIQEDRAKIPPPPPSDFEKLRADVDFIAVMQGVEL